MGAFNYRRVLLKLSGESLNSTTGFGLCHQTVLEIANAITNVVKNGIELGLVIGGGNFFRGVEQNNPVLSRVTGDQIGMLATLMNALALRDAFFHLEQPASIFSALSIPSVALADEQRAISEAFRQHEVVIFAAGIGHPYFTTDTAASLRSIEIGADLLLKATKVDGVYSADPTHDKQAILLKKLTFDEVIEKQLRVMDLTAMCLCRDNGMPLRVFNMNQSNILAEILQGVEHGTLVRNDK